jgi:uncharacterized membrane-anchored protein
VPPCPCRTACIWATSPRAVFAAMIAVPALAYRRALLAAISAFWFAYILPRPLGASFVVSLDHDGPGWGPALSARAPS